MASHTWTYDEAIEKLNSFQTNASVLQQQRKHGIDLTKAIPLTRDFLQRINCTQDDLRRLQVIHIAGSKGKGSVAAFCESLLRARGFKTGLFTSPHLIEARERIRINGAPISQQQFAQHMQDTCALYDATQPDDGVSKYPTYFKATFLLALKVFLAEKVDVAVVEVGLGGLYDATNVIDHPVVCGITHIGYEHTSVLGDTLTKIAHQKCGVLKPGVPSFVTPQTPETLAEFKRSAELRKVNHMRVYVPNTHTHTRTHTHTHTHTHTPPGLSGTHQRINAALAVQLCRTWEAYTRDHQYPVPQTATDPTQDVLPEVSLQPLTPLESQALQSCAWPGRAQVLQDGDITYYLDGAHTVDSCKPAGLPIFVMFHDRPAGLPIFVMFHDRAMAEWLESVLDRKSPSLRVLIFNCTGDREPEQLLRQVLEKHAFDVGIFCPNVASLKSTRADQVNHNASSTACQRMQRRARDTFARVCTNDATTHLFPSIEDAITHVRELKAENEASGKRVDVIVTGSLHLVGGVLGVLGAPVA
ncbi:hypothetical protein PTSG_06385 [Salpingoeca rosetta]|uniref:Folylpolyglutamate synthase n=1 Tax=Salpingoeca rosetta (strain ATCC 50818 / BSB-021) TaxID=946362 RepID=F2UCR7_SALR5|nr:uncharacterized protein PTSG_06385 [Salpingoeca rosetta]EGD74374.1 hypothetical protein PTSG_06385 [Salpingoeca rosetta]|eukprot:XP_004993274.1 hypothetical protein PTSG_06385 [Salpingoeca rosetta]